MLVHMKHYKQGSKGQSWGGKKLKFYELKPIDTLLQVKPPNYCTKIIEQKSLVGEMMHANG